MTYIDVTDVRNRSGAPDTLITDSTINSFIEIVEKDVEKWLNTKFTPTEEIDMIDGNNTYRIFTKRGPLLSVRELVINGDEQIEPKDLVWSKAMTIKLVNSGSKSTFIGGTNNTYIRYLYGRLQRTESKSKLSSDSSIGKSENIEVDNASDFEVNDWVDIYGTDGHIEAAQITNISGTTLTMDELVKTHTEGSIVVKLDIPEYIKDYMAIEAALAVAINSVGSTYKFNASYGLGDLNVTKGVPYTHWRESVVRLLEERKLRRNTIYPTFSIVTG